MKCKSMHMLLLDYLDDNMTDDLRRDVSLHLETCRNCSAYFNGLRELPDAIEAEKQFKPDPYMYTRIVSKLDGRTQPVLRLKLVFQILLIAFMMLFSVYSGILLGKSYNDKKTIATDYQEEVYFINAFQHEDMMSVLLSD